MPTVHPRFAPLKFNINPVVGADGALSVPALTQLLPGWSGRIQKPRDAGNDHAQFETTVALNHLSSKRRLRWLEET